jgi:hypothetical protein
MGRGNHHHYGRIFPPRRYHQEWRDITTRGEYHRQWRGISPLWKGGDTTTGWGEYRHHWGISSRRGGDIIPRGKYHHPSRISAWGESITAGGGCHHQGQGYIATRVREIPSQTILKDLLKKVNMSSS